MRKAFVGFLVCGLLLLSGCATNLTKPSGPPQPSKVRFGEFKQVELKPVALNPAFAAEENQRATKKIDEHLGSKVSMVIPATKKLAAGEEFSSSGERTLQIIPTIKELKFIGGAARFFAGAMAGSSAVLMQVQFVDSKTKETVAEPEFYRASGAYAGAWSVGGADNMMLEDIAKDVAEYISLNR